MTHSNYPFIFILTATTLLTASFSTSASNSINTEPVAAANSTFQSINNIHKLVTNYVKQKIDQKLFDSKIEIRKLPPSLQLKQCKNPLQIQDKNLNRLAGRMTISVHCQQPKWRVFVPVTVDGKKPVVMSAKGIIKKSVISPDDVKQVMLPYQKIPIGSLINPSIAVGMRAKKAIGPNKVIKIRDLQPPYWVFKNQQVNIITRIGGIEVKTRGTALKNGVVDEQVPVKNSATEKIIKGIVIAPNTVLIP